MAATLGRAPAIALAGFMAAGKTTVGRLLAARLGRPFVDADEELERATGRTPGEILRVDGEERFRALEADAVARILARDDAPVVALGGGAVLSAPTRAALAERALVAWLDLDADAALARVAADGVERPLAVDAEAARRRHADRGPVYAAVADAIVDATAPADVVADALALGAWTRIGLAGRVGGLAAGRRAVLVADRVVADRVGGDFAARVLVDGGEAGKGLTGAEALWRGLAAAELERGGLVVAAGGGGLTDVAGFAAATFRRGVGWIAVPTTLVGQVDAAIGGKTAINVAAKNDVGAFWLPEATLADPAFLETLPPREWAGGFAECIKTALLAGGALWRLVEGWPEGGTGTEEARAELVRRCAGTKALVVAEDPTERGRRAVLNLGHTIGHGVEAAAGYGGLTHGEAVAVGLAAALWLSVRVRGLDAATADRVEELLAAHALPVRAPGLDPDAVLEAMRHDKKRTAGTHRFVLLDAVGAPVIGVEVPEPLVREAVERAVGPA